MAQDTEQLLLEGLQGLAHSLHKPSPTSVIRPPGLNPTEIIQHNVQLLTGRKVSIDTSDFIVPHDVATAILAHLGAKGTDISEVTVSGSRRIQKAPWLASFK